MVSRKIQKQQTRQAILAAAIDSFAAYGFEAASVGNIAAKSGTKKALVQYHFSTKEDLWKAAVNELWEQRETALPKYFAGENQAAGTDDSSNENTNDAQQIRFVFKQIIRFAFDHPAWVGIMFREAATPGPRLNWFIEQHLRHDYQQGIEFIKTAQQCGLLPEGEPLDIILIISGALFYLILVAPLTQKITGMDTRDEKFIDRYVDTLMAMLE